jgi:hypothetical protein
MSTPFFEALVVDANQWMPAVPENGAEQDTQLIRY